MCDDEGDDSSMPNITIHPGTFSMTITPQGRTRLSNVVNGFKAPVVGSYYTTSSAQSEYNRLCNKKSGTVTVLFEPTNRYDTNAAAVWTWDHKHMLGHIDRASALQLTNKLITWLDDDHSCMEVKELVGFVGEVTKASSTTGRLVIEIRKAILVKE